MTEALSLSAQLSAASLGRLMPLHLTVDPSGRITGCGPTLAKLTAGAAMVGRDLFDVFEVRRPSGVNAMSELRALLGHKLRMFLREGETIAFRGLAQEMEGGAGLLINLSLGIGVIEAVRNHSLTDGDFAPTDLAVEMMYLVEANAVTMGALRDLAERLEGGKRMAEAQALTDTLTGLKNRRALSIALEALVRGGQAFGLMHMDLDFFKAVNDTLGHAAGDHVLRSVAAVLRHETRDRDIVARVGGDEFVLIFPGIVEGKDLESTARRIIEALTQPIDFEGNPCRISASIGITLSTQYALPDPDRMQSDADEALYASKRGGRGRAQLFIPDDVRRSA